LEFKKVFKVQQQVRSKPYFTSILLVSHRETLWSIQIPNIPSLSFVMFYVQRDKHKRVKCRRDAKRQRSVVSPEGGKSTSRAPLLSFFLEKFARNSLYFFWIRDLDLTDGSERIVCSSCQRGLPNPGLINTRRVGVGQRRGRETS
jgi:hypothetical protein